MQKIGYWIVALLFVAGNTNAQNLKIIDLKDNTDVTEASITIQSQDNHGWVGFESLNLSIKVINTSGTAMQIGAKKIEHDTLQHDVQHTFCFAGNCYAASTFVSPYYITLASGAADSQFIAHYLFDNTVHVRGINHVSYVFYDVANPDDSVAVYVTYNTQVAITGVYEPTVANSIRMFPNPASNEVRFEYQTLSGKANLWLTNIAGEKVLTIPCPVNEQHLSFSTADLQAGVYFYSFSEGTEVTGKGMVVIRH